MEKTNERLARWNDRYRAWADSLELTPSAPLEDAVAGRPPGAALDLACGAGRHALYLAERGFAVTAVDGAAEGVALLLREAQRRGVGERIQVVVADLESSPPGFSIEEGAYDLICDFYYLHRPLLPLLARGLRPGGVLCAAIHLVDPGVDLGSQGFRLQPGELSALVRGLGLDVLREEEVGPQADGHRRGCARIIARAPGATRTLG